MLNLYRDWPKESRSLSSSTLRDGDIAVHRCARNHKRSGMILRHHQARIVTVSGPVIAADGRHTRRIDEAVGAGSVLPPMRV